MQILILGMHRSGTSLIARLINMMGAYVGEKQELLPADSDNPKGFWERRDVLHCNQELLRNSGCAWHITHNWNPSHSAPEPTTACIKSIIKEMDSHGAWIMKDPRFCLTLPHWLPHIQQPLIVMAYRNPLEIAQSLKNRNGMPFEYGLALWEHHAVHAIRTAHNLPCVFASHAAIMNDPVAETANLLSTINEKSIGRLSLPASEQIIDFIEPKLQHAKKDNDYILTPHQELLCSMLRSKTPLDSNIQLSPQAKNTLEALAPKVSGAPI